MTHWEVKPGSYMSFQDSQFTKLPACLLSVGCSLLPSSTDVAQLVPSNDSSSWWLTLKNTSLTNPKPFKVGKILYISEHVSRKKSSLWVSNIVDVSINSFNFRIALGGISFPA